MCAQMALKFQEPLNYLQKNQMTIKYWDVWLLFITLIYWWSVVLSKLSLYIPNVPNILMHTMIKKSVWICMCVCVCGIPHEGFAWRSAPNTNHAKQKKRKKKVRHHSSCWLLSYQDEETVGGEVLVCRDGWEDREDQAAEHQDEPEDDEKEEGEEEWDTDQVPAEAAVFSSATNSWTRAVAGGEPERAGSDVTGLISSPQWTMRPTIIQFPEISS